MKKQLLLLIICNIFLLPAHSQNDFFGQLTTESLILSQGGLVRGEKEIGSFVSDFLQEEGSVNSYERKFTIDVTPTLGYEVGEIKTGATVFAVMFLRKKDGQSESKIEFLTIYEQTTTQNEQSATDKARTTWMELCNAHQAGELVEKMYTSNAYYYNRGRLLQGTAPITEEYDYMNRTSYSLKLTPKHLVFVTSDIAYEIGQCSGSYNNPYMLLWQKQPDGNWQVLMDTNN